MGNNAIRTHGVVGKPWSYKGSIFNIEAVDQVELTVDAMERSFTFHEQRDFDAFFRDLKPVAQVPSSAPASVTQRAKPVTSQTSPTAPTRNLHPLAKAEPIQDIVPIIPQPAPAERLPVQLDTDGMSVPDIQSNDPLAYMKGVLMESMNRLRNDKGYIGQAKEITNAANSFVNVVLMEKKIRKGV
jgi:hypothetical protein